MRIRNASFAPGLTSIVAAMALSLGPALALGHTRLIHVNANLDDPGYAAGTRALDTIEDGSFEAGTPSTFWIEDSPNFGTPLCTVAAPSFCGDGGGTTGPRTGDWWGWFGGIAAAEVGTLSQDVTLTDGALVTLTFYVWAGACGDPTHSLSLAVDATSVWSITCDDPGFTAGYAPVNLDLSAYADGGTHTFVFQGIQNTPFTSNFSLDDVSLGVVPPVAIPALDRVGLVALVLLIAAAAMAILGR